MKWKAHTRTAEKILEVFGALHFDKYEKDLINGIISPDNEDEKNHYNGREQTALDYLLRARKKRLEYDTGGCFFQMGVGFHYIQDMWTGLGPDYEEHRIYLDLINRCDILDIHESLERYYPVRRKRVIDQFRTLEKTLSKPLESEKEMKKLVLMRRPYESSAFLDLNLSFRVCFRIAEMVLKTMYNIGLQESLDLLQQEYVEKIKQREIEEIRAIESLETKIAELSMEDSAVGKINKWNMKNKLEAAQKSYEARKHLEPITREYDSRVTELCKPQENWYNIDKPVLEIDKVLSPGIAPKEMVTIEKEKVHLAPESKVVD